MGTPASIKGSETRHNRGHRDEPLDSVISDTTRALCGELRLVGHHRLHTTTSPINDRGRISRRPGVPLRAGFTHGERGSCSWNRKGSSTVPWRNSSICASRVGTQVVTTMAWVSPTGENGRAVGVFQHQFRWSRDVRCRCHGRRYEAHRRSR